MKTESVVPAFQQFGLFHTTDACIYVCLFVFMCSYHCFVRGEICKIGDIISLSFNKSDESDGVVTKDCQSKLIKLHPYGP